MKQVNLFIPRLPIGTSSTVNFLGGGRYRVWVTVDEKHGERHSHNVTLRLSSSHLDALAAWRKVAKECERCYLQKHPEERNKPTTEPFLTEWLALHKQHLKALREGKKNPLRLCDAVKLADAKYEVYRRGITAAAELTLRRARRGVARVTAKGKK